MIKEKQKGDYRFIQCHNPAVAEDKKANREKRLKKVEDRINSLERLIERKHIGAEDLYRKVASVLEEQRLSKFFRPGIQSGKTILYNDERVKAHVFMCVPAYLFEKLIELQCRRASLRHSGGRALSLLSRFKAIECKVAGRSVTVTNRVDEKIRLIMDAIDFSISSQAFENANKV